MLTTHFAAALLTCLVTLASSTQKNHTVDFTGSLDKQDETLSGGEYVDVHFFEVTQAGPVTVHLSGSFDGYLIVQPPDFAQTKKGQLENDDWEGNLTESRIEIGKPQIGRWKVAVTTASKGVGGSYTLSITLPGPDPNRASSVRTEQGKLSKDDAQLGNGEFFDRYDLTLSAGEKIVVTMESSAFDTFLAFANAAGDSLIQNDDFGGSISVSKLEYVIETDGDYILVATSAPPGVTGAYRLTIERSRPDAVQDSRRFEKRLSGTLAGGDELLDSGAFVDLFELDGLAGQQLNVDLNTTDFDPILFAMDSAGEVLEMNDDFEGSTSRAFVTFTVPANGAYAIAVTSYGPAKGSYEILITGESAGAAAPPVQASAPPTTEEKGRLEAGDEKLSSGEYLDNYYFELEQGETLSLFLSSDDFNAFLALVPVQGDPIQVNDSDGSTNARIEYTADQAGKVRVLVTTFKPGEQGAYTLSVTQTAQQDTGPEPMIFSGTLDKSDSALPSGEYYELHEIEMTAGTTYLCTMISSEVNSYMGVTSPSNKTEEDDDGGGDGDSFILYAAQETGTHRIMATTSTPGETGAYTILVSAIDVGDEGGDDNAPQNTGVSDTGAASSSDSGSLATEGTLGMNTPQRGRLEEGDATLDNGEFQDTWLFRAKRGESFSFEVSSQEFDTYLVLVDAEENILQNDDLANERNKSGIDWTAPVDGNVAVVVTSYRRGETGNYEVIVRRSSSQPAASASMSGKVYGVFVGISDYPGTDSDLPMCDTDAVRLQQALVEHAGMAAEDGIVLINRDARGAEVREAIAKVSSRVKDGDTFVFFYSGHGSRVKRTQLVERDPDGHDALDEALVLYDGLLLDDELDALLTDIHGGTTLVILDSCFSGGFSKDVISRPNRMGLFSSHEDVTSATAAKFKAGGFLAAFAAEAISDDKGIADENHDGMLSAAELSQFIYEGYRNELVRAKSSDYLDVGDNLGFQQLIVDRGGVGVQHPLFAVR